MQGSQKSLLAVFAGFVHSTSFKYLSGALIALLALAILVGSFFIKWVSVPPASLEHTAHVTIVSIQSGSPASRRQILPGDIVTRIGDTRLTGVSLQEALEAYSAALMNATLINENNGVPMEVYRGREQSVVSLPLPRTIRAFAVMMPLVGHPEDIGLTLGHVEADETLHNPDGAPISAMALWLGGNEAVPTLDLKRLSEGESGFGAVRGVDRLLILMPLAALGLLVLVYFYVIDRIPARRALLWIAIVVLFLAIFPAVWQALSSSNWRGTLREMYPGEQDAAVISREVVETYNLPAMAITTKVARIARQQRNVDLVNATTFELNTLYDFSLMRRLALITLGLSAAAFILVALQEAGVLANRDRLMAVIVLTPSLLLLAIFVYGFIGQTLQFSLTDWGEEAKGAPPPLTENVDKTFIGTENYSDLMTNQDEFYFRDSLVNTFFFTILFLLACLIFGFGLAFLVDQRVQGEGLFRTIFLFPMSLSFVVTGTIWRWLFQPGGGINVLPQKITNVTIGGHHLLPEFARFDPLDNSWMNNRGRLWAFDWEDAKFLVYLGLVLFGIALCYSFSKVSNRRFLYILLVVFGFGVFYAIGGWDKIWPPLDFPSGEPKKGYQLALSGVIIAATWQMAGYVMALFLAGIRGVPDDLREAARVDGCAEWQVYFYVILPSLRPIALSAVIILGHISLKIFDLVFSMAGPDNNQTIVPGILLYTKAFRGNRLASGSAVAIIMLVLVSFVIIPYLWSSLRQEERR